MFTGLLLITLQYYDKKCIHTELTFHSQNIYEYQKPTLIKTIINECVLNLVGILFREWSILSSKLFYIMLFIIFIVWVCDGILE